MRGLFRGILFVLVSLGIAFGAFWWWIGPDWRAFLSNPPMERDVLFWSQEQRENGFRMLDDAKFIIKSRKVEDSDTLRELPDGAPLSLDMDLDAYLEQNQSAAVVVLHKGKVRLEKYGLRFDRDGRWTSFSVAKSLTSTLLGAAIKDGHIKSLDDKVTDYVPGLIGSPYEDVSLSQLLSMTSGVDWNEDYEDKNSDVARFLSHKPQDDLPQIVSYMQSLGRAHPPGESWNYSTGETNLIGIVVSNAIPGTLADYLSEKIWKPYGMQQHASWLVGDDGLEISGCCIQAATRDFARFGQFILEGAEIGGESIVPDGWLDLATQKRADIGEPGYGYGFQWWTYDEGTFTARGIFGQGIFIDPERELVIASNSNWTSAIGQRGGESPAREAFYKSVQAAIDAEE